MSEQCDSVPCMDSLEQNGLLPYENKYGAADGPKWVRTVFGTSNIFRPSHGCSSGGRSAIGILAMHNSQVISAVFGVHVAATRFTQHM